MYPPVEKNFLSEVRFELTDVPPSPQNEKVGFQVNVTFRFWQQTSIEMQKIGPYGPKLIWHLG